MATVQLQNNTGSRIEVIVLNDPLERAQRTMDIAVGGSITLDSLVASISPDVYLKISAGMLIVTAGVLPVQLTDAPDSGLVVNSDVVAATKATLISLADATDLPSAIALANAVKAALNAMNA